MVNIKLSNLAPESKQKLQEYKAHIQEEFKKIGENSANIYAPGSPMSERIKAFSTNIQKEEYWNLKQLFPSNTRVDTENVAFLNPIVNEQKATPIFPALNERLGADIKFCKNKIKQLQEKVKEGTPGAEDQLTFWNQNLSSLKHNKVYAQFLQIQTQAVISEYVAIDKITNVSNKLAQAYAGASDNPHYLALNQTLTAMKNKCTEQSIYPNLQEYSAKDTLKARVEMLKLSQKCNEHLNALDKEGLLLRIAIKNTVPAIKNGELLKSNLHDAVNLFKVKNDVSYHNPTVITDISNLRNQVTNFFEKVALISGTLAIGATAVSFVPPATPIAVPIAVLAGATSMGANVISIGLNTGNIAHTLITYGVLPTRSEVKKVASAAVLTGISHIGPVVHAVTNTSITSAQITSTLNKLSEQKEQQAYTNLFTSSSSSQKPEVKITSSGSSSTINTVLPAIPNVAPNVSLPSAEKKSTAQKMKERYQSYLNEDPVETPKKSAAQEMKERYQSYLSEESTEKADVEEKESPRPFNK